MKELLTATTDRSKRRAVDHWLFFREQTDAESAATSLRVEQYQVDVMEQKNREWLVLARKRMVPTPDEIAALAEVLKSLAARHYGRYDGWQIQLED